MCANPSKFGKIQLDDIVASALKREPNPRTGFKDPLLSNIAFARFLNPQDD